MTITKHAAARKTVRTSARGSRYVHGDLVRVNAPMTVYTNGSDSEWKNTNNVSTFDRPDLERGVDNEKTIGVGSLLRAGRFTGSFSIEKGDASLGRLPKHLVVSLGSNFDKLSLTCGVHEDCLESAKLGEACALGKLATDEAGLSKPLSEIACVAGRAFQRLASASKKTMLGRVRFHVDGSDFVVRAAYAMSSMKALRDHPFVEFALSISNAFYFAPGSLRVEGYLDVRSNVAPGRTYALKNVDMKELEEKLSSPSLMPRARVV